MKRDVYAYRDVAVELVALDGTPFVRPMAGQAYSTDLPVHCSRQLRDTARFAPGTCFLVSAKLTDRLGGDPYLYVYPGDPVRVLSPEQAGAFLADRRRLRL